MFPKQIKFGGKIQFRIICNIYKITIIVLLNLVWKIVRSFLKKCLKKLILHRIMKTKLFLKKMSIVLKNICEKIVFFEKI